MNKRDKGRLTASYKQYRKRKIRKKGVLHFFRSFMPEIIFRTTRLEGEPVTRRKIANLLNNERYH